MADNLKRDFLQMRDEIERHEQVMNEIAAIGEIMKSEGDAALALLEAEKAFQADLTEGTVESLRRARDRFNNLLDRVIDKALNQ
jgi:hypothetical protein